MTRAIADNALLLEVLAGPDAYDPPDKILPSKDIAHSSIPLHLAGVAIWVPIGVEGLTQTMMWGDGYGVADRTCTSDEPDGFSQRLAGAGQRSIGNHQTVHHVRRLYPQANVLGPLFLAGTPEFQSVDDITRLPDGMSVVHWPDLKIAPCHD